MPSPISMTALTYPCSYRIYYGYELVTRIGLEFKDVTVNMMSLDYPGDYVLSLVLREDDCPEFTFKSETGSYSVVFSFDSEEAAIMFRLKYG